MQGGARAAFATPSWGPARMMYFYEIRKSHWRSAKKICIFVLMKTAKKFFSLDGIDGSGKSTQIDMLVRVL